MSAANAVWFEGSFREPGAPLFAACDPALLQGDGLFETFALQAGQQEADWLDLHEQRLRWTAGRLGFAAGRIPGWRALLPELLRRAELDEARVRVTLLGPAEAPRLLLLAMPVPDEREALRADGIRLRTSPFRIDPNDPTAGLKTGSRAFHLAAEREARRHGADDALLLGTHGELRECTRWNLFARLPGEAWATPTLTGAFLPGVARARVLRRFREIEEVCREVTLTREQIVPGSVLFATNSVHGVVPVRELDGAPHARPEGLDRLLQVFTS